MSMWKLSQWRTWMPTVARSALAMGVVGGTGLVGVLGWRVLGAGSERVVPFVATALPASVGTLAYFRARSRRRWQTMLDVYAEREIKRHQRQQAIVRQRPQRRVSA